MDLNLLFMLAGFFFAAYAVIGNDSIQTLGTFLSSNEKRSWVLQWACGSVILVLVVLYSWFVYDGDISYGRLDKIPLPDEIEWYHAMVPLALVFLTRFGFPVSTTFLVLSAFANSLVLQKMIYKSVLGYVVAAVVAYALWMILCKFIDEHKKVPKTHAKWWRIAQWCSTGFLWSQWLAHDMANIAVYLPRKLDVGYLILAIVTIVCGLGFIFYRRGGKIQQVVLHKSGTRYVRSATLIDLIYAFILLFFKEYSNIPMSTTWIFVGLLCGRELAVYRLHNPEKHFATVFPIVTKDFFKILFGLIVSIVIAMTIQELG